MTASFTMPSHFESMRPLTIADDDSSDGPRIGGSAPIGLESEFRDDHSRYFGSFPIIDDREFSVFHRFDVFGEDENRDVILHNNQILEPSSLIWAVIHDCSRRGSTFPAEFPGRRLIVGDLRPDVLDDSDADCDAPYSESKLFGRGYTWRYQIAEKVSQLESRGFLHLLQIGLRGDTIIDGFPWDPGFLNVWAADPQDASTYRFCVQQ